MKILCLHQNYNNNNKNKVDEKLILLHRQKEFLKDQ